MEFYFRGFISANFIFLVLSFLGMQSAVAETYKVKGVVSGDVLNIREKPSSESKKVGSIPFTAKGIKKLGQCESGWCKISHNGITGWSSVRYLAVEASIYPTYRVKGVRSDDVLFIRSEPSGKGKQVGTIPPNGRGVKKLGPCKDNRCKISYRGITGWSSMKFLVLDKPNKTSVKPIKVVKKTVKQAVKTNRKPVKVEQKPLIAKQKPITAQQKPLIAEQKPLNPVGKVALYNTTTVRQNGIKSSPYKLNGKTYFIEARGTVKYKTDNPGIYGVDACYLFSFTPSNIKNPPVAKKLLKNSGSNDVCANAGYNPKHIYRSKPFVSNNSYQFWIDNSAYRAQPMGRGFLTVNIYEISN